MKITFPILCLMLLLQVRVYAQDIPFEIYYANKPLGDTVSGYFLPQDFEIRFKNTDTTYTIKKGTLSYTNSATPRTSILVENNRIHVNARVLFGGNLEFEITQLEKSVSGKRLPIDSHTYRRTIFFKAIKEVTDEEIINTNGNTFAFKAGNKFIDPIKGFNHLEESSQWELKIIKENGYQPIVKEWELVLVRGVRPVSVRHYKNISEDISLLNTFFHKGDFLSVKIITQNPNGSGEDIIFMYLIRIAG